jgi:glutathione peroxidase
LYPDDVVVVAIPCNQFGMQENGTPADIAKFAHGKFSKLVVTERTDVNGAAAHPIVKLAQSVFPGTVKWNFDARLCFDRSGKPVARFDNSASTSDIKAEIEKHL